MAANTKKAYNQNVFLLDKKVVTVISYMYYTLTWYANIITVTCHHKLQTMREHNSTIDDFRRLELFSAAESWPSEINGFKTTPWLSSLFLPPTLPRHRCYSLHRTARAASPPPSPRQRSRPPPPRPPPATTLGRRRRALLHWEVLFSYFIPYFRRPLEN
jgi:hypothetical protein